MVMHLIDDQATALAAGMSLGRLDARLEDEPAGQFLEAALLRREALAVAATEGFVASEETLARVLQDETETFLDRGARTAHDAHRALSFVVSWHSQAPDAAAILELLRLASKSNPRRRDAGAEWQSEEDAAQLAESLAGLDEAPDAWKAAETFRRLMVSGTFSGQGFKLALLLFPWLVRVGFSVPSALCGIAAEAARSADAFRSASPDADTWAGLWMSVTLSSADASSELLGSIKALRRTLAASCPHTRSTSRVPEAIDCVIRNPIVSTATLSRELALTPRGTKIVVDRLMEAGVIEVVNDRRRNRIFVCRKALAGRA